jgi:hypothetical protein
MTQIVESASLGFPPAGKPKALIPTVPGAPTTQPPQGQPTPGAPTAQPQQGQPGRAAPNEFDPSYEDPDGPPYELTHARILYQSALIGATASSPGGSNPGNVLNPATYSRWAFTAPQLLTITLPANRSIDAVGLAAHNFGSSAVTVEYSASDADIFLPFAAPQSGAAAMLFLRTSAVSVKRLRVTVGGTGARVLGIVSAGIALQMQRPIYRGHAPATMARATEYQSNESEGGQWLGRNVIRQGLKLAFSWSNLSAAWVRQYFDPFAAAAVDTPFFIAWNPAEFPREVAYAWTTEDTAPSNTGPRDLMSVTLNARGTR